MKSIEEFEKKIGIEFKNKSLLQTAFTHRSYLNENRGNVTEQNERLEFLGDAVLELITTEHLFNKFPQSAEGEMTAFRSALVNTNSLAESAGNLSMDDYLLLSKGESRDKGRARQYILANTFEAVIGAIYLDQGYKGANKFINAYLLHRTDEMVEKNLWQDPKSRFQERAQEIENTTPQYRTTAETGPDHDKQFTVGVFLKKDIIADGEGKSKQEAEQEAAKNALDVKGW